MKLKAVIEGLLFVSGEEGITLDNISEIIEQPNEETKKILEMLIIEYAEENRGIQIEKISDKYKLTTKKEHANYYKKLTNIEQNEFLSSSALETLAIIAYNEPVTRIMVDEIRGVGSAHIIRKLAMKNLIEEVGRSELPGRPKLYGVTEGFLNYFGLKSTKDLPQIGEEEKMEEIDLYTSKYEE